MCDTNTQCETDAYEVIQKQIFLNCFSSSSSPVSSSSSTSGLDEEVMISTVIDYLYKNFNETNQDNEFLEDLRKSLTKVSPSGRINWTLFKEGSHIWISKLQRHQIQDGNNNDDDDDLARDSNSSGQVPKEDQGQEENDSQRENSPIRHSSLPFINVVNVSSYSPDSNSTQRLTDTSVESESEVGYDIDAAFNLRLRIQKFDEENATLREEVLRVEDVNTSLQQQIHSLNRRLEQLTVQNRDLQRENDEQKDLLSEAEQQEKSSKLELQKILKEKTSLQKKIESIQKHNESIIALKTQMAQEKKQFAKQNEEYQKVFVEKNAECESLKEIIIELKEANARLQETYESSIRFLREKNTELLNQNLELQTRWNNSGSNGSPITPPLGYINSYMHSTPYPAQKISPRKSLYAELKASGFSPERTKSESKIVELEEELSWCNEEIEAVAEQIESVIQRLAAAGQKPYVPHLNLQPEYSKIPSLPILKQEIAVLMNLDASRGGRQSD